jgi:hypothetical protein
MRHRHAPPPPVLPGWGPLAPPPPTTRFPRAKRQALILAALFCAALVTGVLRARYGWVTVILAFITWQLLDNAHAAGHTFRALREYAVVFALAWILASANLAGPNVDVVAEAQTRAPSKVEAQSRVEQLRHSVADFLERVTAPVGQSEPKAKPKPKGHH